MKNRLKVLRAERDWSQSDLAERLDVSRQSVNAIETGKYDPEPAARLPHRRAVRAADRSDFLQGLTRKARFMLKKILFAAAAAAASPPTARAAPASPRPPRSSRRRFSVTVEGAGPI